MGLLILNATHVMVLARLIVLCVLMDLKIAPLAQTGETCLVIGVAFVMEKQKMYVRSAMEPVKRYVQYATVLAS